jgi:FkbM family methyltransferase
MTTWILLCVLLLLAAGAIGYRSRKIRNRLALVYAKITGRLTLTWSDLAVFMILPSDRWRNRLVRRTDKASGDGLTLYQTPLGPFWGGPNDLTNLLPVIEEELISSYERGPVRVRPGDVVLDLGANLGTFVRVALNRGARTVVAFEPESHNIACLERTFADAIAQGRLRIVKAAVWEETKTLHFSGKGLIGQVRDEGVEVPGITIDDAVDNLRLDRVDFIKADIEGAERYALSGASNTISRFHPRMAICTYHLPDDPVVLPQIATKYHNYNVFTFGGYVPNDNRAYFY